MCASDSTSAEFACVAMLLLQIAGAGVWPPRIETHLVLMTTLTSICTTMVSTPKWLIQMIEVACQSYCATADLICEWENPASSAFSSR